jgi:hypothetical protein
MRLSERMPAHPVVGEFDPNIEGSASGLAAVSTDVQVGPRRTGPMPFACDPWVTFALRERHLDIPNHFEKVAAVDPVPDPAISLAGLPVINLVPLVEHLESNVVHAVVLRCVPQMRVVDRADGRSRRRSGQ